jgi:haloalkane dehalogenase
MIPVFADAGFRVIAMDHLGMGRSDKPIDLDYYTYQRHVDRLYEFVVQLDLENITPFVQDWGSLIGLNVIGNHPERFARVVVGDGTLPLVEEGESLFPLPENPEKAASDFQKQIARIPAQQPEFYNEDGELRSLFRRSSGANYFGNWIYFSRNDEDFRASMILEAMTYFPLTAEVKAAYDAPFPARIAMGGPRSFPGLVNQLGGATQSAWEGLAAYDKPFLTIWASNDPGNLGRPEVQQLLIDTIPGAADQPHTRLPKASHFLQDDQGGAIAALMVEFIRANPLE